MPRRGENGLPEQAPRTNRESIPKASRAWAHSAGIAIALGIAYFLAARLSLLLLTKPDGVAVFWPAAGVSAGVLIGFGPRARLPVIVGTMLATIAANLLGDRNIWSAIVFALCNAGEAVLVAALIERFFGPSFNTDRLRNVIGLLGATIFACAISGVGGTLGFELFHNSPSPTLTIWHHWFASDALGVITVAPLVIGLVYAVRDRPPRSEVIEGVAVLVILTIVSALVVLLPREPWVAVVPTASLFPLLLWVSARCRPMFAAAAAFIVALTVVWTTTFGIGILGDPSLAITQRILCAQASILTVSLCALVLAALFAERRAHELRLTHSNMMLEREQNNKLMSMQAVTGSIAHELKQPLTAISANGETAQLILSHRRPDLEAVRTALNSIVDDSHRAGQTLSDIRALFSKTDREQTPVDINEITVQVSRLLREQLKAHDVTIHVELASDLPPVRGHKGQLQEVVINLCQNAIDAVNAIKNGPKTLRLRTKRDGDDAIVVEVEDSGPGIDAAGLNTIFDPFFTTKSQGMGLGLAICRMIIERHEGRLLASSDGTSGALFQIVLPTRERQAGTDGELRVDKLHRGEVGAILP
ncbi:MAG TPA: MASE1 domain-containing protein [Pseudolabrys sp.]|jgi:signal transduction histidine kinase